MSPEGAACNSQGCKPLEKGSQHESPVRAAQTKKDKKGDRRLMTLPPTLGGQGEGCVQVMSHQSPADGPWAKAHGSEESALTSTLSIARYSVRAAGFNLRAISGPREKEQKETSDP